MKGQVWANFSTMPWPRRGGSWAKNSEAMIMPASLGRPPEWLLISMTGPRSGTFWMS